MALRREQRPGRQTAEWCVFLLQELARHAGASGGRQVQVPKHWAAEAIARELGDGASISPTTPHASWTRSRIAKS
jgi:hypothetical protein